MIRQLIIPGIVAGVAHVIVLFTPPEKTPPPPPLPTIVTEVINLGEVPIVPPDPEKRNNDPMEFLDIKVPPVVFETIATNVDSLFIVPFNPIIAPPNFSDTNLTMIPPGDYYDAASRRRMGEGVKDLFSLDALDNRPRTIVQGAPEYPPMAKSRGEIGEVLVNFTVDENGFVHEVRVVRSTHPDFEGPTVRAVSKWRFEPGRKDGKRVRFRMSVPVAFSLNDDN